jgi:hypothetical protein
VDDHDYQVPFKFTGKLEKLTIKVDRPKLTPHQDDLRYCVHAGVRPGLPLDRQTEADKLWIRDSFLRHTGPFPKYVVQGHTPTIYIDPRQLTLDTIRGPARDVLISSLTALALGAACICTFGRCFFAAVGRHSKLAVVHACRSRKSAKSAAQQG